MSRECPGTFVDPMARRAMEELQGARRALFLDRDGVINVDRGYVHTPEQTSFLPGIFELGRAAKGRGYLLIVVTNQAGIARGLYSEEQFLGYTRWLHERFAEQGAPLLSTYYCPHHPTAGKGEYLRDCDCRKPAPGMILAAARRYGIDLAGSALIGDKPGDMAAGCSAGVGLRLRLGDSDPGGVNGEADIRTPAEAVAWLS